MREPGSASAEGGGAGGGGAERRDKRSGTERTGVPGRRDHPGLRIPARQAGKCRRRLRGHRFNHFGFSSGGVDGGGDLGQAERARGGADRTLSHSLRRTTLGGKGALRRRGQQDGGGQKAHHSWIRKFAAETSAKVRFAAAAL